MSQREIAEEDKYYVPPVRQEFANVDLGDKRLNDRVLRTVDQVAPAPGKSLPQAILSRNDLQATYRLLENPSVTSTQLMKPHIDNTVERCGKTDLVVVAHDTTEFIFPGSARREELGFINSENDQGFLAHFSIAFSADESSTPLGTLAMYPWTRETIGKNKAKKRKKIEGDHAAEITDKAEECPATITVQDKESVRWFQQVDEVHQLLSGTAEAIHVGDREADIHSHLLEMIAKKIRFVVRASQPRVARLDVESPKADVFKLADGAVGKLEVDVAVSARKKSPLPDQNKSHPPRERRKATLTFSAIKLNLRKPKGSKKDVLTWVAINMVHVVELNPSEGVEPIEWYLYTSEPIDTPEQIKDVVDYYRKRWGIEEFFKALKTGCAIKSRQLESYGTILNLLAFFIPMAWQMLLMRTIAHHSPNASATTVLSPTQIEVLRECGKVPLPSNPTAQEAMIAVAILGGYIKTKRPPGWLTIGRGMEELMMLERGWVACLERAKRCAQS